ncbi:right-handed parallel beta-helix repeat-containing protein [Anaerohalosphaeraceae bacterium U12dextr]|jgi:uncharacterized repeat protein (TIGR01451 family)
METQRAVVKGVNSCVFFISLMLILLSSHHTMANVMTMTFEEFLGRDGTPIGSFYPRVHFQALTSGNDWLVSDVTTGNYNASSWPSGQSWGSSNYWIYDYVAAWTGTPGDGGKITFGDTDVVFVELGYCCATQLTLTAYDTSGNVLDTDTGPANRRIEEANANGPGTLRVDAPSGNFISYVTIHDSGNYWIVDNISVGTAIQFTKDDNLADDQCASPEQAITYHICFDNPFGRTIDNPFIIDWLPEGVDYNSILSIDPLIIDDNYNPEEHYYRWDLDDIDPNDSSCVELVVTVNYNAAPGGYLHNVAELWGTVMVNDPNDPNIVYPENRMVARAIKDTPVCCWRDMPEVLYVDKNAVNGANNGLDWQNAFTRLQDALEYARSAVCGEVQSIYCAQGTYSPGDNENDSFVLPPNISLYGGFPTGGCDFSLRNPKRYQTTLSGKIDDTHRNDNVVSMGSNTLLNGLTVSEASIDGYGIYGSGADFALENCIVEKNEAYGVYVEEGNVTLEWCTIRNNKSDGIRHIGSGYTLTVENCWIRQNMQNGIACQDSTPFVINSVVTESDLSNEGRAGIMLFNPTSTPHLQNVTVAHNKTMGVGLMGSTLPEIKNCIVYHNGGPALAGFSADQTASYSCIEDCNSVNNNLSLDPKFAYFDPNNVRIMADSPCHDSGLTLQENYSQVDMDNRDRVLGTAVDRGAYEIECEDTSNSYDLNADGLVNMVEFSGLSRAWLGHDPNDPVWLADPNLADPNLSEGWYEWKYKYNFEPTGSSQYLIDLADLTAFLEDASWLWKACWLDLEELQMQQMTFGGEEVLTTSITEQTLMDSQSFAVSSQESSLVLDSTATTPVPVSIEQQVLDLKDSIRFLEQIWLEEPDIQQGINAEDWQEFMKAVYQSLYDLQTESVQIE